MGVRISQAEYEAIMSGQPGAVVNPVKPGRRKGGAKAQKSGASFEARLDKLHESYEQQGAAAMMRMPVPTIPTMIAGKMARVISGKSGVDFWGIMRLDGVGSIPIVIEAKATSKRAASMPIARPVPKIAGKKSKGAGSGLKLEQLAFMVRRYKGFGVVPLVLWWNENRMGCLGGMDLCQIADELPKRIPVDRFIWLEPGVNDWLRGYAPQIVHWTQGRSLASGLFGQS